ncbi:ABC-2 type transporter-domain-containing protein [Rhodocollybia butyracea]|uniref:ABC-2 type transporter-domain-containing protein n=1 Tax=Rhodocollybia butyracea TaxID=206335 RepID=A0A9P5P5L6_9AGAR|nr:ABC-2 type transporter-domain-containing protein [Rhodocollybia butyracea]
MADTPDAMTLYDEQRNDRDEGHVDISSAQRDFKELSRQLSRQSQRKNSTRTVSVDSGHDVEKASRYPAQATSVVTWEDLEVNVFGVSGAEEHKIFIRTFANAILGFIISPVTLIWAYLISPLLPKKKMPTKPILHKSSGVLKPAIANQREDYASIGGQVLYAGMDAAEMAKFYKGEVVYNEEDDRHIATLTVEQTLKFALSTKTPGPTVVFPGVSRKEFDDEVLNTLLRMLNITHTKRTLVGDEFSWDNSTRGLDASTALDFFRFAPPPSPTNQTLQAYQAGEGIYDLFDKVMVLSEGRQVYYGPPSEARAYFEGLGYKSFPRQSTADYLTGCTDINERQFAPGRSAADVPSTPKALEGAFRHSQYAQDNAVALEKYKLTMATDKADQEAFRAAVTADKKKGGVQEKPVHPRLYRSGSRFGRSSVPATIAGQVPAVHEFHSQYCPRSCYRCAFFALPTTAAGAFTRGGLIFAALLTTCLDAFMEMPMQMLGRPILRKQTSYSMYRPSAIAIANTFADMPFSATRVLLFNIAVYFMSNLNRSAGGFFTFHLLNYIAFLTMQGFFRTFGQLCTNFDSAFRLATFFIPNFIEYTGYILPVNKMKRWLFWIYYLNPVGYAWQAIMENEFRRIDLTCDGAYVVPLCTLFGATAASTTVSGHEYLFAAFNLDTTDLWRRCFLVIVGMFFFFQITQVIALEFFPQYVTNRAKKNARQQKVVEDEKLLEEAARDEREQIISDRPYGKTFTWEKLNYVVPVPGGTRRLLHDVNGYVKPGTLTALMLNEKNIGVISGDVLVDGRPLTSDFARGTAYAEQMDVHEGTATVREAMRFSAYLRQPAHVSIEEKNAYVEEIIELLELQDLSEAVVYCLGVEARKRLTIRRRACKQTRTAFCSWMSPRLVFDAQSAWNLVRFLRKLADQGQAILCTIHQPSSLLFESFDRLLLLETGDYFARHGAACPPNVNPAEYMLEAIGAGVAPRIGDRDWKDVWLDSPECAVVRREIDTIKAQGLAKPEPNQQTMSTCKRHLVLLTSSNSLSLGITLHYGVHPTTFSRDSLFCMFISLWISLSFLQLGNSLRDLQFRVFSIFWVVVLPAIVMSQIEPMFVMNRRIFIRESSSRIYSPYAFAVGQLLGEIPYNVLCGIVYWVLMVYPMHFGQGSAGLDGTGFQLWVIIVMMLFGVSLGQLIAAISPSVQVAGSIQPFIGLVLTTFCGVTIPFPTMNSFWRSWLYQLSPYTRTLAAMVSTELQ